MTEANTVPLVFNIQKFSIHDGPGIRTTIFFKGCPLHCRWCHNPESQRYEAETLQTHEGEETAGQTYTVEALAKKAAQDIIFYDQSGGGVTLSGGEVMAENMAFVTALLRRLNEKGIDVGIDTSGCVPYERFQQVLPYTAFFLYDMKVFDPDKHRKYTGADNRDILANMKRLSDDGAVLYLRLIMVPQVNMDEEKDIQPFIRWLKDKDIHVERLHLLPYHQLGKDKYTELGRQAQLFEEPSPESLEHVRQLFLQAGYDTVIGG